MPEPLSHLTSSGGLLSNQFLAAIRQESFHHDQVRPERFGLPWQEAPKGAALEDTIATSWELLLEQWEKVRGNWSRLDLPALRSRWIAPFFTTLDFDLQYQRAALEVGVELRFVLSHRGWKGEHAPVVHSVLPRSRLDTDPSLGLDTKSPDAPRGARSPHDTLQSFLNAAPQDTWGILTNGILLRLLRDFHHTYTKGFVQFDLEGIFETRNFADFRALYRLCHASRFLPGAEGPCPLEQFYRTSQATGIAVGEDLRGQVKEAIQGLGNGFLSGELLGQLQEDEEACRQFYGEVLHVIYRILFLLFAEQRGMLPGRNSLYAEEYSIARLRERAEGQIPLRDEHGDLWETLKVTFRMVSRGVPKLGIFGYDGMLFDEVRTPILDRSYCRNSELLRAVRYLTLIDKGGVLQRISYADLSVEEIGSIYESLLDYTPRVTRQFERFEAEEGGRNRSFEVPGNTFFLDPRGGSRKTSGSYYTRPALVNELIKSALVPVLEERLQEAGYDPQKSLEDYTTAERKKLEEALLSLRVCDAGGGSGAFLIAANDYLGRRLAQLQAGEEYVTDEQVRRAKREVLQHCIYGVDLNPMAVELAKVSLWINAAVQDLPLNFLDHRIKVGNSLIGTTPRLLKEGIPDEAFNPIEGDDPAVARSFKKRNKEQRLGALTLPFGQQAPKMGNLPATFLDLAQIDESTPEGVQQKAQTYAEVVHSTGYEFARLWADAWCAAFFWPLTAETDQAPTEETFRRLEQSPYSVSKDLKAQIRALAERHRFFHWHLEFPEVFGPEGEGGFDVYLGNPPWDTLSPDAKEFFAAYDSRVRFQDEKGQKVLIEALLKDEKIAYRWAEHRRGLFALVHFIKQSGRFTLFAEGNLGKGDFNIYRMFVELALRITRPGGRCAQIVPEGLYNGANCAAIREALFSNHIWGRLLGFENARGIWFPGIDTRMKFALYATRISGRTEQLSVRFNIRTFDDLASASRGETITIPVELIREFSPDAIAVMEFGDQRDIDIATKMYRRWPKFGDEQTGLPVREYMCEMHMGNDRELFSEDPEGIPVFEGRMVDQYDYRAKGYREGRGRSSVWVDLSFGDPAKSIQPQWRVLPDKIPNKVVPHLSRYRIGFCDVASPTNERSLVGALLPPGCVCGHKIPTLVFDESWEWAYMIWLAVANSFAMDYLVRKKVALSMTYTIVDSLPFPRLEANDPVAKRLVPLVLNLTCCGPEMMAYWNARAAEGWCNPVPSEGSPPGVEDPEQRLLLRAEIDAIVAHDLFTLSPGDVAHILETFPIVRRKDEAKYGEYRTKRVILEIYDSLAEAAQTGQPYQTRLSPGPADPAVAHSEHTTH